MSATGNISGIVHRQSATLPLRYGSSTMDVPITERSVRRFRLMQEDFIQLEFSLVTPIHIGIGDYVVDPIFGTFFVTEEQMPKYNVQTGGYDYSLRLDAAYMRWRNMLHCLTVNGKRMETSWHLTDSLNSQAQQIADNVNAAYGYTAGQYNPQSGYADHDGYGIDVTADNASEVKLLSFEGTDIITALNMIAEAWSCEWWVTADRITIGELRYAHTIHFGKCELDNEPIEFALGDNVESMDIARDQQNYANRIYAYGGKQNVPSDYDKRLAFKSSYASRTLQPDPARKLTLDMIEGDGTLNVERFTMNTPTDSATTTAKTWTQTSITKSLSGDQHMDIALSSWLQIACEEDDVIMVELTASLRVGTSTINIPVVINSGAQVVDGLMWSADINMHRTLNIGSTAKDVYLTVAWKVTFGNYNNAGVAVSLMQTTGTMTATVDASAATKPVTVTYNGTDYAGTFHGDDSTITFLLGTAPPVSINGKEYTVAPLNYLNVPASYYTSNYDTGTLRMAGDRRIHLPLADYPNRYIDGANTQGTTPNIPAPGNNAAQIVERMVVWENVYPKLTLRIKAGTIVETQREQEVEFEDGSKRYDKWTQYSFEAEWDNAGTWEEFPFRKEYMLDGTKLQVVFSSGLLNGMTYDVDFLRTSVVRYTIIRNEDYGTQLPNDVLKPAEGDTFILVGWNPRAIGQVGLVTAAEQELATKAQEYLAALQEGQFTITNKMMSDVLFTAEYGGNGNTYGLLVPGARVNVQHDALPNGEKQSRIIGYEYKLDMPFDTPTYIVGETDAYSRLKQIEKQLQNL